MFLLAILLLPIGVKAEKFDINQYNVTIGISNDRVLSISENYEISYKENSETWERSIDLNPTYYRDKNEKVTYEATLDRVSANKNFIEESSSKQFKIIIKDPVSSGMIGNYNISYLYHFSKDKKKNGDELLFDLVTNTALSTQFIINFPTEINDTNVSFLLDHDAKLGKQIVNYQVNGKQISGTLKEPLKADQVLTLKVDLEEGYFIDNYATAIDRASINDYWYLLIFPGLSLVLAYYFWLRYGDGNKIMEERGYYPPAELDSVELGFLYKGYINYNDIITLIPYLASQGYLRVVELADGTSEMENNIELVKLKEYSGNNAAQKTLFDAIFEQSDRVMIKDLNGTLSDDVSVIIDTVNNDYHKSRIYNKNIDQIKLALVFLSGLSTIIISVPMIDFGIDNYFLAVLISIATAIGIILFSQNTFPIVSRMFISIPLMLIGAYFTLQPVSSNLLLFLVALVGLITAFSIRLIASMLPIRTLFGNRMLGKTYGFSRCLYEMNESKLEELTTEDPLYYEKMLPYAYDFGFGDRFLRLPIKDGPTWYETYQPFEKEKFHIFMKNFNYQLTTAVLQKQKKSETEELY